MSYLRIYRNEQCQVQYQTYDRLGDAQRDKLTMGGELIYLIGLADNA